MDEEKKTDPDQAERINELLSRLSSLEERDNAETSRARLDLIAVPALRLTAYDAVWATLRCHPRVATFVTQRLVMSVILTDPRLRAIWPIALRHVPAVGLLSQNALSAPTEPRALDPLLRVSHGWEIGAYEQVGHPEYPAALAALAECLYLVCRTPGTPPAVSGLYLALGALAAIAEVELPDAYTVGAKELVDARVAEPPTPPRHRRSR